MDRQFEFLQDSSIKDTKFCIIQARVSADLKDGIVAWCKANEIPVSVAIRMIIAKIISDRRTYPGLRRDPAGEIETSVDGVIGYLPVIQKQIKINPGLI